jgi:phosphomethylpyrimidine synthase
MKTQTFTTQMAAARAGHVTPQMIEAAQFEGVLPEQIRDKLAAGTVCLPANPGHTTLKGRAIGAGLRTKVNVNLGISSDCGQFAAEQEKVRTAIDLGADAIMDLSCSGKTQAFRRWLIESSPVMIGTVPVYDAIGYLDKELAAITADEFFQVVENHARDGVDFMTIHAGLNRRTAARFRANPRVTSIVSRGGSLLYAWMEQTGQENPFFAQFDRLLDLCARHDVTLSLGDACRPGSTADATDAAQIEELITLGELTRQAWKRDVQVMIEGPGHMNLREIPANILLAKKLCHGAPLYVLGPLATDIAPGYDHITAAIGGAQAAAQGADFLCYVTPAEHLRLPDRNDLKEGLIATRIAAHAADLAKGIPAAENWDLAMSQARQAIDWEAMYALAIDPEKARAMHESTQPAEKGTCTMCGNLCAMRNMNQILSSQSDCQQL